MSYIHEALNKAQKDRDARNGKYNGVHSGTGLKKGKGIRRPVFLIALVIMIIFLAFVSYSWLDSKNKQTDAIPEHKYKMPSETSQGKPTKDAKSFFDRGRIFHKKGRLKEAKRLYEEALKVDPSYVNALNNLAVVYMHEKNYSEAQQHFEKAIRLKPDNVDPYYNLACVYSIQGELPKSLAYLKKAVAMNRSVKTWAQKDGDLNNVRKSPEFKDVIR